MKNGYKWLLLVMLSFAFFFHQADRALFGLLTIPIQEELHLTDVQIGWINTVLSWTLAAMTTVAGFCGDRFSRKWLITCSLIFWSLMTVCMGFVGDFQVLGVAITVVTKEFTFGGESHMLGLGEATVYALATSIGYGIAMVLFAGLREHLQLNDVPKAFKGLPIALITVSIMAMAFLGFSGIV